jgi:hypothetical protein
VLAHRKAGPARKSEKPEKREKAEKPRQAKAAKPAKAAKKAASPALPEKAQALLDALPALAAGQSVELRVAAERLREAGLLSRSGSSTKLFGQFPELFELSPAQQPNHVRRRA